MSDLERLQGLARMIAAEMGKATPRPTLRIVGRDPLPTAVPNGMDAATRESHLRIIRHLRRRWGLHLLVDQATFGHGGLDGLPDEELAQLHRDMHRARECMDEGIALEDAGLIRNVGG